ncbi:MAG: ECF transporter S component [Eubacterium sp.]
MKKLFNTKNLVLMAVFAALAAVLMLFEFPLPFIAPSFYEIDLSEIPILIGSFIMGPVSGVIMEAIKIILKLCIKGTTTAYVGDFANFCIGICFVVPTSIIYQKIKTKKGAITGMLLGTVIMAVAGVVLNYFVMIPFYVKALECH